MQFFQSFLLKGNFFGTHATKYDFYSFEYPLWSVATHLSKWLPPLVEPIAIGQATFRITTTKQVGGKLEGASRRFKFSILGVNRWAFSTRIQMVELHKNSLRIEKLWFNDINTVAWLSKSKAGIIETNKDWQQPRCVKRRTIGCVVEWGSGDGGGKESEWVTGDLGIWHSLQSRGDQLN